MVRLFTGIKLDLTDELSGYRSQLIESLRQSIITWVDPEKLHITLHFFGDVDESEVAHITELHKKAASVIRPFEIDYERTGFFGQGRQPKIIWFGFQSSGELDLLHGSLVKELEAGGYHSDRKNFHPHLTLGRVKNMKDTDHFRKCLDRINQQKSHSSFRIKTFMLIKSILKQSGPEYTTLEEFKLR